MLRALSSTRTSTRGTRKLWLDLGDLGELVNPAGLLEQWQDHGMGLLRTILHSKGVMTDMFSTRACTSWQQVREKLRGYDMLIMNVRSYTFPIAYRAAKFFKELNPEGIVITGGMHATVALDEMSEIEEFDNICQGAGERIIVDLIRDPRAFPRVVAGIAATSMAEWPIIDRTLWPKPGNWKVRIQYPWPLEPACGWGPPPVATILTSRVCPWQCSFCNENSYIPNIGRRPVEMVIEELNYLDKMYGPLGSVVIHDSMFFQNPRWLEEWVEKYPRMANRTWPYWAAARADTVRQWPELFEALVRETNWMAISIGFESGSDRVLKILNKECTEEDNYFTIELLHRIADDLERKGRQTPFFWANIMLGIPGEAREDAFKTMRMVKYMERGMSSIAFNTMRVVRYLGRVIPSIAFNTMRMVKCRPRVTSSITSKTMRMLHCTPPVMPSISFYAPYPGSALGHQLIAEDKSLMTKENYHRFPSDEKVKGIDYRFYRDLLAGKYDDEINQGLPALARRRSGVFMDSLTKA